MSSSSLFQPCAPASASATDTATATATATVPPNKEKEENCHRRLYQPSSLAVRSEKKKEENLFFATMPSYFVATVVVALLSLRNHLSPRYRNCCRVISIDPSLAPAQQ